MAIIMPDTRLMVANTRNRNFLRNIFTSIESTYHQTAPPSSTPITTSNSPNNEEESPNTDIPANTAINTTTVIGFDTVKKNNDK